MRLFGGYRKKNARRRQSPFPETSPGQCPRGSISSQGISVHSFVEIFEDPSKVLILIQKLCEKSTFTVPLVKKYSKNAINESTL